MCKFSVSRPYLLVLPQIRNQEGKNWLLLQARNNADFLAPSNA